MTTKMLFISIPILAIYSYFLLVHPIWEYQYYDISLKRCHPDKPTNPLTNPSNNPWSIHGLWPEYNLRHWPQFCQPHNKLNLTLLNPILPQLHRYWYSCYDNQPKHTDQTFWEHEWEKHGTCTGFSQFDYFNETLHLFMKDNTQRILNQYCQPHQTTCLIHLYLNFTLKPTQLSELTFINSD